MYCQHKTKQKNKQQLRVSPTARKGKMASDPPEHDTTRLSAGDQVSPSDSFQQLPTDLMSPATTDPEGLLSKFCSIVRDEINAASQKLSSELMRCLKELGHRTNQLEHRMDLTTTVLEGHKEVDKINAELDSLRDKLEDTENRAQELAPKIPLESLEFDRIHRSLAPKPTDGPPRDIIMNFHFYYTKEQLLQAARECPDFSFLNSFPSAVCGPFASYHCKETEPETLPTNLANSEH